MENQTLIRIPLKYWPIFNTLQNESVGKIFKNILSWCEKLNEIETVYYNLIMTDINAIQYQVVIWQKHWIKWKEYWKLWWRPKKNNKITPPGDTPVSDKKITPNINKTNINIDNNNIDNNILINKNIINNTEEKSSETYWNKDINELILEIKWYCKELSIAYDKKNDRRFWKHILTNKDFTDFYESINQTRNEFIKNIILASIKINYRKWPCSWPMSIYQNYVDIYNQTKSKNKKEVENNKVWFIPSIYIDD